MVFKTAFLCITLALLNSEIHLALLGLEAHGVVATFPKPVLKMCCMVAHAGCPST